MVAMNCDCHCDVISGCHAKCWRLSREIIYILCLTLEDLMEWGSDDNKTDGSESDGSGSDGSD